MLAHRLARPLAAESDKNQGPRLAPLWLLQFAHSPTCGRRVPSHGNPPGVTLSAFLRGVTVELGLGERAALDHLARAVR
jgi:hypothetical protein